MANCPFYCSTDLEPFCWATRGVAWCNICTVDVARLIAEENGELDDEEEEEDGDDE